MKRIWPIFAGILQAIAQVSPATLTFATYLGKNTSANGIAVDRDGFVYVSGDCGNEINPCTLQTASTGSGLYVMKLKEDGSGVVWTVLLPGIFGGWSALDARGALYVLGNSSGRATVVKLSLADGSVTYSVPIAGAVGASMALDSAGNIYVTGSATSALATTPDAYSRTVPDCNGQQTTCTDSFVVKLGANGQVRYSTHLSVGTGGRGIAIDSNNAAWVTGSTLRVVSTSPRTLYGNSSFIFKLDASGSRRLVQKVFDGLTPSIPPVPPADSGTAITVDSVDAVYVVGFTSGRIPISPGAFWSTRDNIAAPVGYAMKLDSLGNTLYSTYTGDDGYPLSIGVDAAGNSYFKLQSLNPLTYKLIVLSADGLRVLGEGPLRSSASAIAFDGAGSVLVAGSTQAYAFVGTLNAYLPQYPGGFNSGVAAKLDFSKPADAQLYTVVNAASATPGRNASVIDGSVAPAETVTLFGSGFLSGPGLNVTFDGKKMPMLYANDGQINTSVPLQAGATQASTRVSVNFGTRSIGGFVLPVAPAAPGLFRATFDSTFFLPYNDRLLALNENGEMNSPDHPAEPGSVITMFLTGAGGYTSEIGDGTLGSLQPPFAIPRLGFGAAIFAPGQYPFVPSSFPRMPAQVLFAGQAPGLLAGIVQVNLRLPKDTPSGLPIVVIYVGNYSAAGSIAVSAR